MHLSARWLVASTILIVSPSACLNVRMGHRRGNSLSKDAVPITVYNSIRVEDRFKVLMFGAICSVKMHWARVQSHRTINDKEEEVAWWG